MSRNTKISEASSLFKLVLFFTLFSGFFVACNNSHVDVNDKEIVEKPEEINERAEDVIKGTLKDILKNSKELGDSIKIRNAAIVQYIYDKNSFVPLWSAKGSFNKNGDSLYTFISNSRRYGLFPEDYYQYKLNQLKTQLISDTSSKERKLDASLWAYSDMLLTSAFIQMVKDIKVGRLLHDTLIAKDTTLTPEYFLAELNSYREVGADSLAHSLEPLHTGYKNLKSALHSFLDSANFQSYTYINSIDSTKIPALIFHRLTEEDSVIMDHPTPDTSEIRMAIKNYQKKNGLKVDGRITAALINRLNNTDREKFIRIAINLDRFKLLQPLPRKYIWVNLPSFYLQLRDNDTVALKSRVVVGKPVTRTPLITSSISDMITYPKWTIPESIIKKEILPGLKKDAGYTLKRGYNLFDKNDSIINPYMVDWSTYKEYIPYKVVQGSGDDNALGILKFNFPNQYSVYLHDTNQRYLFSNSSRALSHGCVRVQAWEALAKYILRNDSANSVNAVPVDSMTTWLSTKQKRYIPVRKPIPIFIRYFTCDASEGKLAFYEDIYGEDKKIRETFFSNK